MYHCFFYQIKIKVHIDFRKLVHVSEKRKILCNVYDIKFKMMYVAAPRKMCRKISKFDYAPNPTWQVAEVGERAGR